MAPGLEDERAQARERYPDRNEGIVAGAARQRIYRELAILEASVEQSRRNGIRIQRDVGGTLQFAPRQHRLSVARHRGDVRAGAVVQRDGADAGCDVVVQERRRSGERYRVELVIARNADKFVCHPAVGADRGDRAEPERSAGRRT